MSLRLSTDIGGSLAEGPALDAAEDGVGSLASGEHCDWMRDVQKGVSRMQWMEVDGGVKMLVAPRARRPGGRREAFGIGSMGHPSSTSPKIQKHRT